MGIIDFVARTNNEISRRSNVPNYAVHQKADNLMSAGWTDTKQYLKKMEKSDEKINKIGKRISKYLRAIREGKNARRGYEREIRQYTRELKDLRTKKFKEQHGYLGSWTGFPIGTILATPIVGSVLKRIAFNLLSPEYQSIKDQIAECEEQITNEEIRIEEITESLDEARSSREQEKANKQEVCGIISEKYENVKEWIPLATYMNENMEVFENAYNNGMISEKFMNAIKASKQTILQGQTLPNNMQREEFFKTLQEYRAMIMSFERNGDSTMLKDPKILDDAVEQRADNQNQQQENQQENQADNSDNQNQQENQDDKKKKKRGNGKFDKEDFDKGVTKLLIQNGINIAALDEIFKDGKYDKVDILVAIGLMSRFDMKGIQSMDDLKVETRAALNKAKSSNSGYQSKLFILKDGAKIFKNVVEQMRNNPDNTNIKFNDAGSIFVYHSTIAKRYMDIIAQWEKDNQDLDNQKDDSLGQAV